MSSAGPTSFLKINDDIWKQKLLSFPTSRLTKQSQCTIPNSPLWCLAVCTRCNFRIVFHCLLSGHHLWHTLVLFKQQYDSNTLGLNLRVFFPHLESSTFFFFIPFGLCWVKCCNSETIYLTRVNIYSGHNCKSIAKKIPTVKSHEITKWLIIQLKRIDYSVTALPCSFWADICSRGSCNNPI